MNRGMFGFPQNLGNSDVQQAASYSSAPLPMAPLQSPARRLDAGPVGFPTPWRPTLISGCLLWLDASDDNSFTYGSGSLVSQWRDKSGNNNHFSQTAEASQPSRDTFMNGRQTVRMLNNLSGLTRAPISHTNCTQFVVVRINKLGATNGRDIWATGTTGGIGIVMLNATTRFVGYVCQNIAFVTGTTHRTPSGPQMMSLTRSGNAVTVYANGSVAMTGSTSMNTPAGNAIVFGTGSAGYGAGTNYEVAEIILYNTALSAQDRITVEQYLRRKWAIVG